MKSTDTPKFEQQWWKKNKGLLVPETGFGKLLGAYEVAEDQMDYAAQITALDKIEVALPKVIQLCKKDNDTVTVLKKFPNLIAGKKRDAKKKLDEEKQKPQVTTPPKQQMKGLEVLWSRDFGEQVTKEVKWVNMKGYKVELKVNADGLDLLDKVDGGSTAAFMMQDAETICRKYVAVFVKDLNNLDQKLQPQERQKKVDEMFKSVHPKLCAEVKEVPNVRWKKFISDKPMWKEYKIETAANITIGSLTLVLGALNIAAAVPTMGATLPLAIVATARGLFKTITEIGNALRSVESDQKELLSSIESLTKAYLDANNKAKVRLHVQEVGAAILKGILGAEMPLFVESLPKCNGAYNRWKPKVAKLRIDHGSATREAMDLVNKTGQFENEMKKVSTKEAIEILNKVKKLRVSITKSLDFIHALGGRITKAEEVEPQLKEGLEELNKATPNYVKVFTVVFPAVVSIGLGASSGGLEIKGATEVIEIVKAGVEVSDEILSSVKEMAEDVKNMK
jgi:hypothetical protein